MSSPSRAGAILLLWLLLLAAPSVVHAEGVGVRNAELRAEEDSLVLNAQFELALSPTLEEALQRGIPLYFVLELEIGRPRWYWFDERLVSFAMTYRLSYNALTRQYRLSTGLFTQTLPTLEDAVRLMSRVTSRPVAKREQLARGNRYEVALRFRLDGNQLPKPFQVSALAARDWQLQSDWYRWYFEP